LSVGFAVDDCSHVGIFLVDESAGRHGIHFHTRRYLLNVGDHIVQMQLKGVRGVLQQIAPYLDCHHLCCVEDAIELAEVTRAHSQRKCGRSQICALDSNASVD